MNKILFGLIVLFATTLASAAGYQDALKQQPPRTGTGAIEVEAVFWYGCPFCYQLEPDVKVLAAGLPADAALIKVAAPLSPAWATHARVFHVARALGILDKAHDEIFALVQSSHGRDLTDVESMALFFEKYGIPRAKTAAVANDERVIGLMRADYERLQSYGLREVPALIVDGRFIVTSRTAGGIHKMADQANELIEKVRQERSGKGSS